MESTKAFTLIELLVVVLIIGILASVALPQYQKAVEKARAAQALTMLRSVVQAIESYYLANGTDFTSFDELTIDIPWPTAAHVFPGAGETRANNQWTLEVEFPDINRTNLVMIRRDGKYQGAGFYIPIANATEGHVGDQGIICIERKSESTIIFNSSLPSGAYCSQIMKGTLISDDQWVRKYRLP